MLVRSSPIVRSGSMLPVVDQNNAPYYRREAEQLRRKAETMISESVRDRLIEIAREYDLLAESIERVRALPR